MLEFVCVYGVDVVVMFVDIMLLIFGMGIDVELVENVGLVIDRLVCSIVDVEELCVFDLEEVVLFIFEVVWFVCFQFESE